MPDAGHYDDGPMRQQQSTAPGKRQLLDTTPLRRAFRVANVLLLVVAVAFVFRSTTVIRDQNIALQVRDVGAARNAIQDRLVGARVDVGLLGGAMAQPPAADVMLWVVDPDSCGRCVAEGFGAWDALGADLALSRRLVVVGEGKLPEEARRALRGTEVVRVSRDSALLALGAVLPNTKLLIDDDGIVLMADSRSASSECGWSFDAQVGALRGVLTGETIRNQP